MGFNGGEGFYIGKTPTKRTTEKIQFSFDDKLTDAEKASIRQEIDSYDNQSFSFERLENALRKVITKRFEKIPGIKSENIEKLVDGIIEFNKQGPSDFGRLMDMNGKYLNISSNELRFAIDTFCVPCEGTIHRFTAEEIETIIRMSIPMNNLDHTKNTDGCNGQNILKSLKSAIIRKIGMTEMIDVSEFLSGKFSSRINSDVEEIIKYNVEKNSEIGKIIGENNVNFSSVRNALGDFIVLNSDIRKILQERRTISEGQH